MTRSRLRSSKDKASSRSLVDAAVTFASVDEILSAGKSTPAGIANFDDGSPSRPIPVSSKKRHRLSIPTLSVDEHLSLSSARNDVDVASSSHEVQLAPSTHYCADELACSPIEKDEDDGEQTTVSLCLVVESSSTQTDDAEASPLCERRRISSADTSPVESGVHEPHSRAGGIIGRLPMDMSAFDSESNSLANANGKKTEILGHRVASLDYMEESNGGSIGVDPYDLAERGIFDRGPSRPLHIRTRSMQNWMSLVDAEEETMDVSDDLSEVPGLVLVHYQRTLALAMRAWRIHVLGTSRWTSMARGWGDLSFIRNVSLENGVAHVIDHRLLADGYSPGSIVHIGSSTVERRPIVIVIAGVSGRSFDTHHLVVRILSCIDSRLDAPHDLRLLCVLPQKTREMAVALDDMLHAIKDVLRNREIDIPSMYIDDLDMGYWIKMTAKRLRRKQRTKVEDETINTSHKSNAHVPNDCLLPIGGKDRKITKGRPSRIAGSTPLSRLHPTLQEPKNYINDAVFNSWNHDQLANTEAYLTREITGSRKPCHYALANRALVRARLHYWDAAVVDAEKSIGVQPSVIGYIAKSVALVGKGEKYKGYRMCDIALEHFHSTHVTFLLLIKAVVVFMAGEHDDAILRLHDLIALVPFDPTCYLVQAYMYLLIGNSRMKSRDYEGAIKSFQQARNQIRHGGRPLLTISLISGWKFDDLDITVRQHLCEALYAAGHTKTAGECLLKMVNIFEEDVYTSKPITKWVSDFAQQCLVTPSSGSVQHDEVSGLHATLNPATPAPLLREWAKATLANVSWTGALGAAVSFTTPRSDIYRVICERLEMTNRVLDASECFHQMASELAGEDTHSGQADWVFDFQHRCCEKLENIGDVAADTERHGVAITHYSAALVLDPAGKQDVFIKRSKARMAMGLWKDALDDINQMAAFDSPSPWNHECVLTKWAEVQLTDGLWKDTLSSAANFMIPKFMIYRAICERLDTVDRVLDASECFLQMTSELTGETDTHDEQARWILDFKLRCYQKLERFGDAAVDARRYDEAINLYSAAISLGPDTLVGLFIKRSKAWMAQELWEDALSDINEAIALDVSSPWGYETKHAILCGSGCYSDAIDAFQTMLSKIAESPDAQIREHHDQYISPSTTRAAIRRIVQRTIRHSPRVLINTSTGRLQNKAERAAAFTALPIFDELVSSMTTRIDRSRIKREARQYFRYAMLSHKWEENEPLFHQVIHVAVYDLDESLTHDKLKMFCKISQDAGFNWAWSDTCCINKQDHFILQEALVAMFQWYRGSAMTIVFLRGVRSPAKIGDLVKSIWNTRAWTFQEYVAAKVIHFYTEDWTPYLGLGIPNHKDSPEIISEMEEATGVSAQRLMALRPGLNSIREKLRLASTRKTTLVEDAAYSLLGIFSVTGIPAIYGEGESALGRLLAHVLPGSGDVSILAWTGQSSGYNSCLPARITVYLRPPTSHLPEPIEDTKIERMVTELRASVPNLDSALMLYDRLIGLPAPWFAGSRMKLPCIAFKLPPLPPHRPNTGHVYRVETPAFGMVVIKTKQDLSRLNALYLVHPWIDTLLDREDIQNSAFAEDHVAEPISPNVDDEDLSENESKSGSAESSPQNTDDEDTDDEDDSSPPPESESPARPTFERGIPLDKETRALRLVARLRQPFGALLLTQASRPQRAVVYKRIAASSTITVQLRANAPLDDLLDSVHTLDVL